MAVIKPGISVAEIRRLIREAHCRGLHEGKAGHKKQMTCLAKANNVLLRELTRACREEPLRGEGIIVCFEHADKIIRALQKPGHNYYWAEKLKEMVEAARNKPYRRLDEIENELVNDGQ